MRCTKHVVCVGFFALLTTIGCAQKEPPLTAPSGEQPGYAERYPTHLNTLRTRFAAEEAKVQAALPQLAPAADKLTTADPATLAELFKTADAEGKSGAYANSSLEADTVARFMEEEKQPLHQKVAGGVSYAAKQKNCSEDLGGAAAGSMDRAVEKQLEERLQKNGEVHRFVEDHEELLGKPNLDAAEKQANAIAELSHLTHVRLELYRRELEASINEASSVRSTLDDTQKRSDEVLADTKASKTKRSLAEKRKASAFSARAALDAEVEQAKRALEEMEQREKNLVAQYQKAFDALIDGLEARAKK
jgi:hypothetical protein